MNQTNTYEIKVNGEWTPVENRVSAVLLSGRFKAINQDGDIRAFSDGRPNETLTNRLNALVG